MTSRERVLLALSHEEPDRTPIFEYVLLSPIADIFLGRRHVSYNEGLDAWNTFVNEKGRKNALRQYVADRLELAQLLGHDMLYITPAPLLDNKNTQYEIKDDMFSIDDPVERIMYRNMVREKNLENLNMNIFDERFEVYCLLKDEMRKRDMDLPVIAPAYFHGVWTDTDLMQTILLEPDVATAHFSLGTRWALLFIEKYLALGIEQISVGGDFAGNRLIISPESYREFIVPELKKISHRIREAGCWTINTSDGNIWPVINDFLIGSGVDGYLEIDMRAGMDLGLLKKKYGDKITFYGNMDCGEVLSFYTPEEIEMCTIDCLEAGMGKGGHIFCASNAITPSIPVKNYLAMINAYRKYFGLKPLKSR